MAVVLGKLADLYHFLNVETVDERTNDWLLMSSPVPTIIILALYLRFVLKTGPKWMRDRKPFNIDTLLIVYNALQIVGCIYLVYIGVRYAYGRDYCILCQPVDRSSDPAALKVASGVHMYFLLKIVDLLDTVFFVLRKKGRQISFLHLYHHTGMVVLTWSAVKWYPGGHSVFTGFINSIIHVIMYAYYLLTAFSPRYKGNVWWKKYITQMQIVQFFMITAHWVTLLFVDHCGYPTWVSPIMISQNFLMLALFGDFYRKSYLQPATTTTANKKEINNNVQNSDAAVATNGKLPMENGTANGGMMAAKKHH